MYASVSHSAVPFPGAILFEEPEGADGSKKQPQNRTQGKRSMCVCVCVNSSGIRMYNWKRCEPVCVSLYQVQLAQIGVNRGNCALTSLSKQDSDDKQVRGFHT